MAYEVRALDVQVVEQCYEVRSEAVVADRLGRAGAAAVAAQIWDDHAVAVGESRDHVGPHLAGAGEAVHQQERVAEAMLLVVELRVLERCVWHARITADRADRAPDDTDGTGPIVGPTWRPRPP